MASIVVKATSNSCTSQMSPPVSPQDKGSRNKRKFPADPPLGDPNKTLPCQGYEFSAERFGATLVHGQQGHSDVLKLDVGLSGALRACDVGPSLSREDLRLVASHDADWSDLTESELELLVLSNLDATFKSAIRKIVACGYTEEVATKAVLRSGLCYGCKDSVSNVVDNTLPFLKNGHEIDLSMEQNCFEDLQQLEKHILAELVCVLREVRPFFSTGDAMWCLLICDMNVSHACAMDGDTLSIFGADEASIGSSALSSQPQVGAKSRSCELDLPSACKSVPAISCFQTLQSEASTDPTLIPSLIHPKNSTGASASVPVHPKSIAGNSLSYVLEEKFVATRKVHSGSSTKRECILRQKSLHLEKSYRMYRSKGSRKLSGFGGLILDKKLRSVSESTTSGSIKSASLRLGKAMGVDIRKDDGSESPCKPEPSPSPPASVNAVMSNAIPCFYKTNIPPSTSIHSLPEIAAPALSSTETGLSLSLPAKGGPASVPGISNSEASNTSYYGMAHDDKSSVQWFLEDKKNEMIIKLLRRVRELENQLQEWTEWANQKVMQAARSLSKDKVELRSLRQEREEVERLKKEKQSLEENNRKKLTEMENALCKASVQVEGANYAVRKLEVENMELRKEMEAAKSRAAESATSCREALQREKHTPMNFRLWQKQKSQLEEVLSTEKHKVAELLRDVELAKQQQGQQEGRWQQEKKAKEELLSQATSLRKERQQLEASAKSEENMIQTKAETDLHKCKDHIQKLQKEISPLRLKADSSKIAALRRGIHPGHKYVSELVLDFHEDGRVKRERECVMCLSEEMSVVFLPCAHQVVCTTCNELHEKQGMRDCPSCRSTIQCRLPVCYAHS